VGSITSLVVRVVPAPGGNTRWLLDKITIDTGDGPTARTFTFTNGTT
jgi:hypothetical protein